MHKSNLLIIIMWWNWVVVWTLIQTSTDFLMWSEKGQSEGSFNQKWSCLPPWSRSERALSDAGERQASARTAPRLSACVTEEERVTKARALGVIRKGLMSCFWSMALTLAVHCKRPSRGHELTTTRKASKTVFSHTGMNLTLCCQIYRVLLCIYMIWGNEREEERQRQTDREGGSGGVHSRLFTSLLTLQEN